MRLHKFTGRDGETHGGAAWAAAWAAGDARLAEMLGIEPPEQTGGES